MTTLVAQPSSIPLTVRLGSDGPMPDGELFELCARNPHLRIERNAKGRVLIMSPAGGRTSSRNANIVLQLGLWSEQDGRGVVFDSSGGFLLPNGAVRSPDAAWVEMARLRESAVGSEERFLPLCPTFVIELRSPSDELTILEEKMREYMDQGTSLGWLIDPQEMKVHVYRKAEVRVLSAPDQVDGSPELPGFKLDLTRIWQPGW